MSYDAEQPRDRTPDPPLAGGASSGEVSSGHTRPGDPPGESEGLSERETEGTGAQRSPSPAGGWDLAQVVSDHYEAMFRYAFRLAGRSHDAEDLTQQAFLVARGKLVGLRDEGALRSWLFTVLRNIYLRQLRRRSPLLAGGASMALEEVPAAADPEPLDGQQLQAAIDRLPDEQRLPLLMFYFEKLSYRQIAEALDIPTGTVMSRLARAKDRLRREFAALDEIGAAPRKPGSHAPAWMMKSDTKSARDGLEGARPRRAPHEA